MAFSNNAFPYVKYTSTISGASSTRVCDLAHFFGVLSNTVVPVRGEKGDMCARELEGGARCLLLLAQRECLFRVDELLYANGQLGLFLTVDEKPIAEAATVNGK